MLCSSVACRASRPSRPPEARPLAEISVAAIGPAALRLPFPPVSDIHGYIAYTIPSGFAVLALWAILSFVRNKGPGEWFWNLVAALQVVIAVQVVLGAFLFFSGGRPQSNGPEWLHYVYGGLFPAAVLVAAHRIAKSERFRGIPWAVFGFAALVCFGLTFRALQTGNGWD
jgi:hypothetical protein